jgi:hypothetical protein
MTVASGLENVLHLGTSATAGRAVLRVLSSRAMTRQPIAFIAAFPASGELCDNAKSGTQSYRLRKVLFMRPTAPRGGPRDQLVRTSRFPIA